MSLLPDLFMQKGQWQVTKENTRGLSILKQYDMQVDNGIIEYLAQVLVKYYILESDTFLVCWDKINYFKK